MRQGQMLWSSSTENPAVLGKMVMARAIQTNPFTEPFTRQPCIYMRVSDDGGGGGQKIV